MIRDGRAIMVYSARNEQHYSFEVFQPDWKVVDCEGVELIKRPHGTDDALLTSTGKRGWSAASKRHRARKFGFR